MSEGVFIVGYYHPNAALSDVLTATLASASLHSALSSSSLILRPAVLQAGSRSCITSTLRCRHGRNGGEGREIGSVKAILCVIEGGGYI